MFILYFLFCSSCFVVTPKGLFFEADRIDSSACFKIERVDAYLALSWTVQEKFVDAPTINHPQLQPHFVALEGW